MTISATFISLLITLIGILIVKHRQFLKNKSKLKDGSSDVASILSDGSSIESNQPFDKCEWKTFWPFRKNESVSSSNDKPFAKQDYEVYK